MRFIPRKRISELEALDSASVNTYVVGIDGGVTYKIGINEITDIISGNITGSNGTSGTSGVNGTSGTSAVGINGTDGTSGTNGTSGTTGTSGTSAVGSSGTDGTSGTSGANGTSGTTGIAGTSGTSGFSINSASFATTGSNQFNGNQIITGSLNVSGTITANEYHTTIISSSVLYTSGSTKFGDTWDDEHEFTGSVKIAGNQTILGFVTASSYLGDGRYLTNLPATTNWNYNQEYSIKKTEQLTFSGDYIVEDTYLVIEGGQSASIGEWGEDIFTNGPTGSITRNSNNQYTIIGPSGDTNGSNGLQIKRLFDADTTMSVSYVWNGTDVGEDRPYYDVSTWEPTEPTTTSRLQDTNAVSESGTWTINVPSGSWVAIGVWTDFIDATSGSLQITLPYIQNEDIVQYSPNKYFKKEGTIFIGGNLLVKDSYIQNDGTISVAGEVILIGNSQIEGTGIII